MTQNIQTKKNDFVVVHSCDRKTPISYNNRDVTKSEAQ